MGRFVAKVQGKHALIPALGGNEFERAEIVREADGELAKKHPSLANHVLLRQKDEKLIWWLISTD